MRMQSQEVYQWWRWPLMPLAALAGAILGTLAVALIMWIGMKFQGGYSEDGWYFRYILPLFTSGVFGYIYAKISYEVAPSGKLIAGIVMVTLLGILALVSTVLAWVIPSYSVGEAIQSTVGSLAMMIGAILALSDP